MESLIQEEISYLHKAIDKQNSEPFDIHDLLTQATCNIITTVSMNQRFDYSDERIKNMQLAEFIGAQFLARVMPIIKVGLFSVQCNRIVFHSLTAFPCSHIM